MQLQALGVLQADDGQVRRACESLLSNIATPAALSELEVSLTVTTVMKFPSSTLCPLNRESTCFQKAIHFAVPLHKHLSACSHTSSGRQLKLLLNGLMCYNVSSNGKAGVMEMITCTKELTVLFKDLTHEL